jgi:hypothetical protein
VSIARRCTPRPRFVGKDASGGLGAGGTQYVLNSSASLFANYDLLFNTQQAWHAGSGGVQYAW